jgi:hypothetical protein
MSTDNLPPIPISLAAGCTLIVHRAGDAVAVTFNHDTAGTQVTMEMSAQEAFSAARLLIALAGSYDGNLYGHPTTMMVINGELTIKPAQAVTHVDIIFYATSCFDQDQNRDAAVWTSSEDALTLASALVGHAADVYN